jgi:16S rRNA (guanine527-N7)-methyltransferase
VAPRDFRTRLAKRARKAGVFLPAHLVEQVSQYYELLDRWNRKINLTALDNADEAIDRLVLEPIVAARQFPSPTANLMDIGSGGGSPAIPMKLCSPGIGLTMVEAKARKSAFLREAVRTLRLEHTVVETARYEELLARPELHETFDVLSLRAVRVEVRTLFTLQAFVKRGGVLFLFRGPSGPDVPDVVPPLRWVATVPLVETLQSRLTLLQKVI